MKEREIENYVDSLKLIPATGGVFDVTINGDLVFSKQAVGRHAEPGEVRSAVMNALEAIRPANVEMAGD